MFSLNLVLITRNRQQYVNCSYIANAEHINVSHGKPTNTRYKIIILFKNSKKNIKQCTVYICNGEFMT